MLEVTVKIEGFDEEGNPTADVQGEIIAGVISRIAQHIQADISRNVESAVKSELQTRISASIDELLHKCIQPTNHYGEPKGPPVTLIEYVVKSGSDYLNEEVNERGGRADYNSPKFKRAAFIARQMADEHLKAELKPQLEKAVKEAKEFVATRIAAAIKEAMASAIK